jgi:hypothetical protein
MVFPFMQRYLRRQAAFAEVACIVGGCMPRQQQQQQRAAAADDDNKGQVYSLTYTHRHVYIHTHHTHSHTHTHTRAHTYTLTQCCGGSSRRASLSCR